MRKVTVIIEEADWLTSTDVGELALMLKSGVGVDGNEARDQICDE